jgi:CRP-like cAMP-binding protein
MVRSGFLEAVRARRGAIERPASARRVNSLPEQARPGAVFEARVLRRLLTLASIYQRGDAAIILPCRFADLAALAGVTARTVDRVLSEEAHRGTLCVSDDAIIILDGPGLAARSALGRSESATSEHERVDGV